MSETEATQAWKELMETHASYLGMHISDVLDSLEVEENQDAIIANVVSELNAGTPTEGR